jgi:hypothetical protein
MASRNKNLSMDKNNTTRGTSAQQPTVSSEGGNGSEDETLHESHVQSNAPLAEILRAMQAMESRIDNRFSLMENRFADFSAELVSLQAAQSRMTANVSALQQQSAATGAAAASPLGPTNLQFGSTGTVLSGSTLNPSAGTAGTGTSSSSQGGGGASSFSTSVVVAPMTVRDIATVTQMVCRTVEKRVGMFTGAPTADGKAQPNHAVVQWILTFHSVVEQDCPSLSDEHKIRLAGSLMKGAAQTWFEQVGRAIHKFCPDFGTDPNTQRPRTKLVACRIQETIDGQDPVTFVSAFIRHFTTPTSQRSDKTSLVRSLCASRPKPADLALALSAAQDAMLRPFSSVELWDIFMDCLHPDIVAHLHEQKQFALHEREPEQGMAWLLLTAQQCFDNAARHDDCLLSPEQAGSSESSSTTAPAVAPIVQRALPMMDTPLSPFSHSTGGKMRDQFRVAHHQQDNTWVDPYYGGSDAEAPYEEEIFQYVGAPAPGYTVFDPGGANAVEGLIDFLRHEHGYSHR